jgi:FkbM family methyltransferase
MTFDWGLLSRNAEFMRVLRKEIFDENSYLKHFGIEEGDTVFDVGASAGPFSFSILGLKPGRIFCFEPHETLFKTLEKNLGGKAVCVNAGVAKQSGDGLLNGLYNPDSMAMWSMPTKAKTVNLRAFAEENSIEHVDFLKCDCEGCEYDIFGPENEGWILSKVRKIAGEWHLHNEQLKDCFKEFRDRFLSKLPRDNYKVESMDGVNISDYLFDDWFLGNYSCIMLYILIPGEKMD